MAAAGGDVVPTHAIGAYPEPPPAYDPCTDVLYFEREKGGRTRVLYVVAELVKTLGLN
eukprot:SAG11_NODE_9937_length_868_cov_1.771131_1_plen_57_part_10